jgi:hypothetical protein
MYIFGKNDNLAGPSTALTLFAPSLPERSDVLSGDGGLGCATCSQPSGLGLFESGMDFTAWGWQEWFVIGIGGYVLTSMFFTTKRAAGQVRAGVSKRVSGARRRLGSKIAGRKL